jgi:hypothetical protein
MASPRGAAIIPILSFFSVSNNPVAVSTVEFPKVSLEPFRKLVSANPTYFRVSEASQFYPPL